MSVHCVYGIIRQEVKVEKSKFYLLQKVGSGLTFLISNLFCTKVQAVLTVLCFPEKSIKCSTVIAFLAACCAISLADSSL